MLVPGYLLIASFTDAQTAHSPKLAVDAWIPLVPAWVLVYGTVYFYLILVPLLVIQPADLVERTVRAYLTVWLLSFTGFLLFPTIAPRPEDFEGTGFAAWGLEFLYQADPPHNCFPSLHVAHSFVSALAVSRVRQDLGWIAVICAALVAVSTLFTKQHFFVDLVAGVLLALFAYAVFLRSYPRSAVTEMEHHAAPALSGLAGAIAGVSLLAFWLAFQLAKSVP
ncbi:MAG: phosphatase PAP2 family protein [Pseudomonadota bacterium]